MRIDVLADRLQTLERSRGTIMSQVSHDLRSPLALIRAYAWTLRKGEPSKTRSDRLLTIEEEAQGMALLIDDLLLLGRRSAAPRGRGGGRVGRRRPARRTSHRAAQRPGARRRSRARARAPGRARDGRDPRRRPRADRRQPRRERAPPRDEHGDRPDRGRGRRGRAELRGRRARHSARRDRAPVRAVLAGRCGAGSEWPRSRDRSRSRGFLRRDHRRREPRQAAALGWSSISRARAPWWVGSRDASRSASGRSPSSRWLSR